MPCRQLAILYKCIRGFTCLFQCTNCAWRKIMNLLSLPIRQMSEHVPEFYNKFIKRFREDFERKCSREKNMKDIVLRLFFMSDPFFHSMK